jgi:hypothetical protein
MRERATWRAVTPYIRAGDLAREAEAMLRADLQTCTAGTLEGLRVTAVAALESVYPVTQVVTVRRADPDSDRVSIRIEGPDFLGEISVSAPECH